MIDSTERSFSGCSPMSADERTGMRFSVCKSICFPNCTYASITSVAVDCRNRLQSWVHTELCTLQRSRARRLVKPQCSQFAPSLRFTRHLLPTSLVYRNCCTHLHAVHGAADSVGCRLPLLPSPYRPYWRTFGNCDEAANSKGNSRQLFQIVKSMTRKFQPRMQCIQSETGENLTEAAQIADRWKGCTVKTCTTTKNGK